MNKLIELGVINVNLPFKLRPLVLSKHPVPYMR